MVRQPLVVILLLVLTVSVDSWLFGRRRRTTIVQHHHHTNTNNCNCHKLILALQAKLAALEKKLGRRDVADLLDLEDDYPGLDNLLDHLDTKRDGSVDSEVLTTLLKRARSSSSSRMSNVCNCGRSLVDDFNLGLL